MCTMSWIRRPDGYSLLFNRDELRSRPLAEPPVERRLGNTRLFAPIDPQAGGSWIACNEDGLTVALLNGYQGADAAAPPGGGWMSRGLLVMRLADSRSTAMANRRLERLDLSPFRSFRIAIVDPIEESFLAWTNGERDTRTLASPLISSSFEADSVRKSRLRLYDDQVDALELNKLAGFHRSHEPERGAYSPCMHRDDAHTVSFTQIDVDANEVRIAYAPDSPCRAWPAATVGSFIRRGAQ
jgi:hypothetical protein